MTNSARHYGLPADTVLQLGDGEAVLLKLSDENMFALNDTGAEIVRRLTDGLALGALIDDLARTYQVPAADVARDVESLVADLLQRGLLIEREGG